MQNICSLEILAEVFRCHVHHYQRLDATVGTKCDVRFPINRGWNSRDVIIITGVCDCVKECVFYNVVDHLVCWLI
jgi:hypothetical protein